MAVEGKQHDDQSPVQAASTNTAMDGQHQPNATGRPARSSRHRRKKASLLRWTLDKGAKLVVWYSLITVLFRCPSSPKTLTTDSPAICEQYFRAKDYLLPYAQPYYDQYLAEHVQKAQPYVDRVHEQVYKPGLATYQKHAAPRVAQVQKYGQLQWEKAVKPQLHLLQKQAGQQYDTHLAPHVNKAQAAVQPHYDSLRTSALDIWELEVQPLYRSTIPHARRLYAQGQDFTLTTVLPHAQYAANTTWVFWTRQIWPKLRVLYGENVEPQILRITERLGRYKDGKKLEAEIKSIESSSKLAQATSSASSIASSIASTGTASSSPSSTPNPKAQFTQDLKNLEQLTAKAVEEGSEDLQERIKDITAHQSSSQAEGVGNALVVQLEQTAEGAIASAKTRIQHLVQQLPEDATSEQVEVANDDLVSAIRAAGQNVKHRAQAIREWRQTYESETVNLVEKALESTLETIDGIRDLRLTEIGRKYASSDLPHKEWSKYNDAKKATQSWRSSVEKAARGHAGISEAKKLGEEIESRGMAFAEDVAKELGRLKGVGNWKLAASDASDDFETKTVPPTVKKAKDQVVEKVAEASEAVFGGEEQGTVESLSSIASEKAASIASTVSDALPGSSTGSIEGASSKVSSFASSASKEPGTVESLSSVASDKVSAAASSISEAVQGSSTGSVERASSKVSSLASSASEAVIGSSTGSVESAFSQASSSAASASSQASSIASDASEAVVGSSTDSVESIASQAPLVADSFASSASEAVIGSSTGPVESAARLASSLSSSASEAVVGSSTGSVESAASKVSESASSAVSEAVADKPLGKSSVGPKVSSILSVQKEKSDAEASAVKDEL